MSYSEEGYVTIPKRDGFEGWSQWETRRKIIIKETRRFESFIRESCVLFRRTTHKTEAKKKREGLISRSRDKTRRSSRLYVDKGGGRGGRRVGGERERRGGASDKERAARDHGMVNRAKSVINHGEFVVINEDRFVPASITPLIRGKWTSPISHPAYSQFHKL